MICSFIFPIKMAMAWVYPIPDISRQQWSVLPSSYSSAEVAASPSSAAPLGDFHLAVAELVVSNGFKPSQQDWDPPFFLMKN
jgi:hypothetical protein